MPKGRRKAVQKYHDRVAGRYDQVYDDAYWQWHDLITWEHLKRFLPTNMSARVLDLGCGTGKWAAKLAKSGFHVTCLDISAKMVDRARLKLAEEPAEGEAAPKADFVQADLCDLSALSEGSFALAVALGDPIGCTDSPARAMKQIRRVLADDGVLVATFDNKLAALDFYLQQGDADALARFLRDGRTHWLTQSKDEQFPIHTFAPLDLRHLVESTGFELLDMIGKTVLSMRHHRGLLEESAERRHWAAIEKTLARDPDALGRASHLQIACRVRVAPSRDLSSPSIQ